ELPRASSLADELRASPGAVSGPASAGEPGPAPGDSPVAWSAIRRARPSCQPRCSADMVCRISAGLGPGDPEDPGDPEGPGDPGHPPGAPLLASVVGRGGGLSLSWGARLACLTRRGRPWKSALAPGSEEGGPAGPLGPPEPAEPGTAGSGPVSRDSSHGGLD